MGALQAMQQMRMPAALGGSAGEQEESKCGEEKESKSSKKDGGKGRKMNESKGSKEMGRAAEADKEPADTKARGEAEAPDGSEEETKGGGAGKDEQSPESYEPCVPGRIIYIERCGCGVRREGHTQCLRPVRQPFGVTLRVLGMVWRCQLTLWEQDLCSELLWRSWAGASADGAGPQTHDDVLDSACSRLYTSPRCNTHLPCVPDLDIYTWAVTLQAASKESAGQERGP